jgi:hypothetical protein
LETVHKLTILSFYQELKLHLSKTILLPLEFVCGTIPNNPIALLTMNLINLSSRKIPMMNINKKVSYGISSLYRSCAEQF